MNTEEVERAKQHAQRFAAVKQAAANAPKEEVAVEQLRELAKQKREQEAVLVPDYSVGMAVESLTTNHAVPIHGSEVRSISKKRVDFQNSGMEMRTVQVGVAVVYRGRDLKQHVLIVPWGNIASLVPESP